MLVLDVELERVEAHRLHCEVLVELAGDAGERHRDVDASHLGGQGPRLQDLGLRDLILARCRAHRLVSAHLEGKYGSDDSGCNECQQHEDGDQPLLVPSLSRLGTPQLVTRIRIDRLEDVPRGQGVEN
ncbi:MAG: hypothetical protein E6G39_11070 [Actinobacteria bacterium]|nr:MAG: hypothetical protein E6G39_11070 [Actinomycetota bacterium]